MIVVARESRGMTQRDLSKETGILPAKLSKQENGLIAVGSDDLGAIANATRFHESFFLRTDRLVGLGSSLLFNRRQKTTPVGEQRQVQARVNVVRIQIGKMLKATEIETAIRLERIDVDACGGDARKVARRLRDSLRIPMGPIQSVSHVIEAAGGVIALCEFGSDKIDASHMWLPGEPPMFFMNDDRPGDRHRFNLCHELGHAIMHEFPMGDIEAQANDFASEFLMPSDEIGPDLERLSIESAARIKQRWKVSIAAIIYNAHKLGYITDKRRSVMYATLRAMLRGKGQVEPIDIPKEEPVIVKQMVQLHRKGLGYGDEELRRLFMMDDPFVVLPKEVAVEPRPLRIDARRNPNGTYLFSEYHKKAAGE